MSEIAKRLEKADKLLQKGKLSQALAEFREVLNEAPDHDFARQRAADLCVSLNLDAEAVDHLGSLFDLYSTQNRSGEAINVYKKLARLGYPISAARNIRFAHFAEKNSPRESLEAYKTALASFLKDGQVEVALKAITNIVALEPTAENLEKQAELAAKAGQKQAAAAALLQLSRVKDDIGNEGLSVLERAYSFDPENTEVALGYARALIGAARAARAVEVMQATAADTPELLETYIQALLMANMAAQAEPLALKVYDLEPRSLTPACDVMSAYLQNNEAAAATELARNLESKVRTRGDLREFFSLIRELADKSTNATVFLEYLAQLCNGANREHEYCETLLKLFQLHYAQRSFAKAGDCLDRATEVDAYEPGHAERLELLRGKIDTNRFNAISSRLSGAGRTKPENDEPVLESDSATQKPEETKEPTVLEDLMLQAEIFLQYSMRSKAVERLERIHKLFPREEEKREKLAQLFTAAGFLPKYGSVPKQTSPSPASSKSVAAPGPDESAVDNFSRVTEITRNISRQSSVKSVLFATVNDVGRHWSVSRCVAGLCAPGKAPTAAMEYCAPGITKSDVMGLAKLISNLQAQTVAAGGPISFEKAQSAPELESLQAVLVSQKIDSLFAMPLMDREEAIGIVILEQSGGTRAFRPVDEVVLSTIAEQVVLAVNNARLRSLVKTLAVTDEKSGLVRRSSYLDVLLSEVQRGLTQKSALTLMLMSFGSASALVKEVGEHAVEETMQEIGQTVAAHIRQNDVAVRYDLTSIALMLSDTNEKNAFFVLDKLRKMLAKTHMPGHSEPLTITAGIAELVMQPKFDAVDIVTEAINRVENALEMARHGGGNRAHSIAPSVEANLTSA